MLDGQRTQLCQSSAHTQLCQTPKEGTLQSTELPGNSSFINKPGSKNTPLIKLGKSRPVLTDSLLSLVTNVTSSS